MKNTKMKKFLAVVLSAALVAGLAAGCGSKGDDKEEDKGSGAKTAKVIEVDLTSEEYAFGIDKDQPELVEQVNAFIKEVKENGTLVFPYPPFIIQFLHADRHAAHVFHSITFCIKIKCLFSILCISFPILCILCAVLCIKLCFLYTLFVKRPLL